MTDETEQPEPQDEPAPAEESPFPEPVMEEQEKGLDWWNIEERDE